MPFTPEEGLGKTRQAWRTHSIGISIGIGSQLGS